MCATDLILLQMLSQILNHNTHHPSAHHLFELLLHDTIYDLRRHINYFQYHWLKLCSSDVQTAAIQLMLRSEPPAKHDVLEAMLQHH